MKDKIIILHITDIKNVDGNGVAVAVSCYVENENKATSSAIFNLSGKVIAKGSRSFTYPEYKTIKNLPEPFNKPSLVVFNEVYKRKYLRLYKECIQEKIKYIIIPHGCLTIPSQNEKHLKKRFANILLFNRFIRKADAIQFLTTKEKQETKFKYRKSIIFGNGTNQKNTTNTNSGNKEFIYIGRYLTKVKGLDLLIRVCHKHAEWFRKNKVTVNLYGRDASDNQKKLEETINTNHITDIVHINGPIYANSKKKKLLTSYAFIQTSRREGQPMSIIEALSYGVPCIVTEGTSFSHYINHNKCGIGCDFNDEKVFAAIQMLVEHPEIRKKYSKNAKIMANKDYLWDNITEKKLTVYEELIS